MSGGTGVENGSRERCLPFPSPTFPPQIHFHSLSSLPLPARINFNKTQLQGGETKGKKMTVNCKVSVGIFAAFALVFAIFMPAIQGQGHDTFVPVPAPAPVSDGTAIDQGIAYGLMALALVLTYIIHAFDAPFSI